MDKNQILNQCKKIFHEWYSLSFDDFTFEKTSGFSSFTMAIKSRQKVHPPAILYRDFERKKNAILDFNVEMDVFSILTTNKIAPHCYYYDEKCRIEEYYVGNVLSSNELFESENLRKIANELYRLHQMRPKILPSKTFFDLLHEKWGQQAKYVLEERKDFFPPNEQIMCEKLKEIYGEETFNKIEKCLPDDLPVFCHNDLYHGNIMKLNSGEIKFLDFEFSCLNYRVFDFSNLFAETIMKHNQNDYPYFRIAEPEFTDKDIATLINFYIENIGFENPEKREKEFQKLFQDTKKMLLLSDYMYAMAALPLAIESNTKLRFIPYSYERFLRFLKAYDNRGQNSNN